jgi:hypothetical protein
MCISFIIFYTLFRFRKCDAELTPDLPLAAIIIDGVVKLSGEKDGFKG